MWPMLIGLGAGALMGKLKGDQDRKTVKALNEAEAAQTKYSWATGADPGVLNATPSTWGTIAQGAMAGGTLGQDVAMNMTDAEAVTPSQSTNSPLGGNEMASKLGNENLMTRSQINSQAGMSPNIFRGSGFQDLPKARYGLGGPWSLMAKN
jgi:hypothetical protein